MSRLTRDVWKSEIPRYRRIRGIIGREYICWSTLLSWQLEVLQLSGSQYRQDHCLSDCWQKLKYAFKITFNSLHKWKDIPLWQWQRHKLPWLTKMKVTTVTFNSLFVDCFDIIVNLIFIQIKRQGMFKVICSWWGWCNIDLFYILYNIVLFLPLYFYFYFVC